MLCIAAAGLAIAAALLCVLLYREHTRRTIKSLDHMLDAAIDGTFTEKSFDETRLSALETKLNRYLAASAVSACNLAAEKDKIKELIADISHQTKTPVANILLYTELLSEQNLSKESCECVRALGSQAEKLSFLITSLVKLSRLETGILTLHPSEGAVNSMLEKLRLQFASKAAEKGLLFEVEQTDATAFFDEKWTLEALCNIVDNAIKYTPSGGKVTIRTVSYELFCCIEVADTGIGIAEEEHPQIFSRFYRSACVSQKEGVGIGLSLTRQILAEEGGYIKVASAPGEGAVFYSYLPKKQ